MGAARQRGRHNKARVSGQTQTASRERRWRTKGLDEPRSAPAVLPKFMAGVAVATAATLTVGQVPVVHAAAIPAPSPSHTDLRSMNADVRLAAAASILNIPVNLLIDIINVPYYEMQAINLFSRGNIFAGPWAVTGASNVWGEDPGDMARFMAAAALAIPFPALSGLDDVLEGEEGFVNGTGLGQLFWKYLAAEWPVDPACAADGCFPNTPVSPITGLAGIDQSIWNVLMLTGAVQFPVLRNFFQVPFSELVSGYQFGDVESYDGPIYSYLGIPGTTYDPVTGKHLMPWANTEYKLDPTAAFTKYLNHLMADPSTNEIKIPTLEEIGRAVQTFVAGLVVAFDPITPGSPLCSGFCSYLDPSDDYPAIVQWINDLWPGNENLEAFLEAYEEGTANGPTQANIDRNIELWRRAFFGTWSFSNPPLPDEYINYGSNPSDLAPMFHAFFKSLGLDVDPLYSDTSNPEPPNVGSMESGVYALKGLQVPIMLIFESDLTNRLQAADYVGSYVDGVDTDLSNVANVHWWEPYNQVGVPQLTKAIGTDTTPTIFGYSRGAAIVNDWKIQFNENQTEGISPTFVLVGNPGRPNGGFSPRINLLDPTQGATPTETHGSTGITTTDISYQYDFWSDLPTNMLNPLALSNAFAGLFVNHLHYPENPEDSAQFQASYGDTNYYMIPSTTMPILAPLTWMGDVGITLADALDPITRVLVESAYDRTSNPGEVTPASLYTPDLVKLAFEQIPLAIATGLDNAYEDIFGEDQRPFGTTRPDNSANPYGIGGPPVEVETDEDAAGNTLLAKAMALLGADDDTDADTQTDAEKDGAVSATDGEDDGTTPVDGEEDGTTTPVDGEEDGTTAPPVDGEEDGTTAPPVDGEEDGTTTPVEEEDGTTAPVDGEVEGEEDGATTPVDGDVEGDVDGEEEGDVDGGVDGEEDGGEQDAGDEGAADNAGEDNAGEDNADGDAGEDNGDGENESKDGGEKKAA